MLGTKHLEQFQQEGDFQTVPEMLFGQNYLVIANPSINFVYSFSAQAMLQYCKSKTQQDTLYK